MQLFDVYLFVDWSSQNKMGSERENKDAIWIGEHEPVKQYLREKYFRSRHEAATYLVKFLQFIILEKKRCLIGFDFPYGYPKGLSHAMGFLEGKPWYNIWQELYKRIKDTPKNINNRFKVANDLNAMVGGTSKGPFWGHPINQSWPNLDKYKPDYPLISSKGIELKRLRVVEDRLRGTQEAWKLYGAGSVGSQALVGIPWVYYLRTHKELIKYSKVWPFETGFTQTPSFIEGPFILHAEIWPGVVQQETKVIMDRNPGIIKDKAQVRAMCQWAANLDKNCGLGDYFDLPNGLTKVQVQDCLNEEGWILGTK